MKTKIASFLSIVALSLLTLTTGAFADTDDGFYEKDHVRGFISFGADYRGMRQDFQRYVNSTAFDNMGHLVKVAVATEEGADTSLHEFYGALGKYEKFDDWYLGLHVNVGAQYKQLLTWIDFNFMPPQVSERPSTSYTTYDVTGVAGTPSAVVYPLYDVRWFNCGADWMFGWKLFGENAPINLIPAVGFGLNLINFHFASSFTVHEKGNYENNDIIRDRYYSTLATTFTAELELRIELGRLAVGGYAGYRFARYNDLQIEDFNIQYGPYGTDNTGDTYYLGARVTWYFLSQWEKKLEDKL